MRRLQVWLLAAALLIVVFIPTVPAAAQEECPIVTFDIGGIPYTIIEGSLEAGMTGNGLTSVYSLLPDDPPFTNISGMEARISISVDVKPPSISWWSWMGEPNPYSVQIYLYDETSTELAMYSVGSFSDSYGSWSLESYTLPDDDVVDVDRIEIRYFSAWADRPGPDVRKIIVDDISLAEVGECAPEETQLTRPLQPTDRLFTAQSVEDMVVTTALLANNAVLFGAKKDALVSAVIDGTVTEIERLTPDLCFELFEPATNFDVFDVATARDNCRVTLTALTTMRGNYIQLFSPIDNPAPAYVIHILGVDGREYLQIATHVDEYVFEGQSVTAGCWLGRALNLPDHGNTVDTIALVVGLYSPITGALIEVFSQPQQPFEALTAVWVIAGGFYVDAWNEYALDPSDSAPCNMPEGYEGCMGDSRLQDPSQWQSSNSISWTDPGVLMPTGSFIAATFNLNSERDPVVIIGAVASPLGNLAITFGTTSDPVNYVLGDVEIEVAAGDPDAGAFYTLRLTNTGDNPIRLAYVCVLHTMDRTGGPAPRPPVTTTTVCYFIDSSFENGPDEWETSEGVEEDDGALLLPDDATIAQDLELTAGNYTLVVVTEVWGTGAYEPDDENVTGGVTIEYAYPDSTFVSLGTKNWASYSHRTQTFTGEIVIASDEDGTFTIRPNVVSAPTGVLGVKINSACLTKEGEIAGGEGDGLITPSCGTIAIPTLSATQPGTWATWLWAQLNKFYRCELIKVLNQMLTVMTNFFRTVLWNIRWTQATVIRFGNFMSAGFYWLNGHLHNIAVGQIFVVEGGTGYDSAGDIGDVILGGLKSIIDVFIDLLRRIIDFVFYMLQLVFQLALAIVVALIRLAVILVGLIIGALGQFFDLINALFFAWNNSTPVPIAGLPQCAIEPKEAPVCIFLWTLENTIFSGRGLLFIPFMIAYGSAEMLLWAIAKFSKRAEETGQSG